MRLSSITLKSSITGPGATVISAASVRSPLNRPHREDRICLLSWGQSKTGLSACWQRTTSPFSITRKRYMLISRGTPAPPHRASLCRKADSLRTDTLSDDDVIRSVKPSYSTRADNQDSVRKNNRTNMVPAFTKIQK